MSTVPMEPARRPSLLRAFAVQSRVVGALILRELHTRYGRENIGYLWMIGEPMLLATVIGVMHLGSGGSHYGSDVRPLPFGVMCYTVFILFRGIVNRSEGGLEANAPLLYHSQVTVFDVVVARAILETAGVFLTYVVMMVLLITAGLADPPDKPLTLLAAWALMFWYAIGHSFLITAITYHNHTIGRLVHPYSYFMVGLSGAFTPIGWLPHPFREWLTYVPMTSVFELARYAQFRSTFTLEYFYPKYLIGACLVLTWIGLIQLRAVRDKVHLN